MTKKKPWFPSITKRAACLVWMLALIVSACAPSRAEESSAQAQKTTATSPAAQAKPVYTVQRGEIKVQMTLSGSVAAVDDAPLYFRVDGRVRRVFCKPGERVEKGQVLAELEQAADLQSRQQAGALDVKRAELGLEIAFLEYAAFQDQPLTERQKRYDLPVIQKRYELAQVDLDAVKLRVSDLSKQIEDAQIIAPLDGEVFSLNIQEGDSATAYDPVIEIADPSALEIRVYPDPVVLKNLREGTAVRFERRNAPGSLYPARIKRLPRAAAGGDSKAVDPAVHIAYEPSTSPADLAIAEYVDIIVELARKEGVLWLPPQAVRVFEGRNFAVVREGEKQRRVDLEIGLKTADRVEILSGLKEGETVVGQ